MKTFITALVILCIITALVLCCAHKTRSLTSELLASLSKVTTGDKHSLEIFVSRWQDSVGFFSLTVQKQYIDRVYEGIAMMSSAVTCKAPNELERGILISERALEDIKAGSYINFDNIL